MKTLIVGALALALSFTFGCSGGSTATTPTPPPPSTPTAPTAPSGVAATAGNAQVALTWAAVSGATSYNVYSATSTGVTVANGTKTSGLTTTSSTQTGLTNGTTYFYIVTAVNATGESPASSQVSATPVAPIPPAPAGLMATAGNATASLSWTASAGAVTYNLYYSTTAPVSLTSATKVGAINGTTYNLGGLTNGTVYYFVVTAVDTGGESPASNQATATPTGGITINLVPGTAASGTLQATTATSLIFNFAATAVSQNATATISPLTQSSLPVPLTRSSKVNGKLAPKVTASDTFITSFVFSLNPTSITTLNVPINIAGSVGTTVTPNSTLNLAMLQNNAWVDVATFIVGATGNLTQNIPSINLAGVLAPGTYLVYQPAAGTNTTVSNLGVALLADDGGGMADKSNGVQVVHIYDTNGNLLPTPTISFLDYAQAGDMDGAALTPDGSQGIAVDGGNTLRFFSAVQTGIPVAAMNTVDISAYGGDGDSVAILPTGDEAVVSGNAPNSLVVISGILAGKPVAAMTIPLVSTRDGLVISNDGKVLLARGPAGLSVFAVSTIPPTSGSIGGTVSHSYTQQIDLPALGSITEDGRDGMAISPTDPSRAVVVGYSGSAYNIQLLSSLTTATVVGTALPLPAGFLPYAVSVSPDGKSAVVGGSSGLLLFTGVDTGTLVQVGSAFAPTYTLGTASVTLSTVTTLGITLDGKYVLAGDTNNRALLVIPFTSAGFATAPASVLGDVAIPYNDQLLVH